MAKGEPKGDSPERVWFTLGSTISLGNYNSARVDMGMASDIRPGEDFDSAMDRVQAQVAPRFDALCDQIRGDD